MTEKKHRRLGTSRFMLRVLSALKAQRGFAVLFAALVGSLALALGLAIFNITFREFILSSQVRESGLAFYTADTAMECALYWDRTGMSPSPFGEFGGIISNGLEVYWALDETSGLVAADSSGNGRDGDLTNMIGNEWTTGEVGGALDMNSSDGDDVIIPPSPNPGLFHDGFTERTITAWVTIDTITAGPMVLYDEGGSLNGFTVGLRSGSGKVAFLTADSGNVVELQSSSVFSPDPGTWIHIAAVYDDGSMNLYINGNPESAGSNGVSIPSNNNAPGIGNRAAATVFGGSTGTGWEGKVDDVRIYSQALSSSEIQQIASGSEGGGFTGPINANNTTLECAGIDINSYEVAGEEQWQIEVDSINEEATTTFQLPLDGQSCANVLVAKYGGGTTKIESRGVNICTPAPRRVERGLRATY